VTWLSTPELRALVTLFDRYQAEEPQIEIHAASGPCRPVSVHLESRSVPLEYGFTFDGSLVRWNEGRGEWIMDTPAPLEVAA
jgi:hypothetical protein